MRLSKRTHILDHTQEEPEEIIVFERCYFDEFVELIRSYSSQLLSVCNSKDPFLPKGSVSALNVRSCSSFHRRSNGWSALRS